MISLSLQLGHNSLFLAEQTAFTLKNEDGFTKEEIIATIEKDFINDEIEKLLLNEYYEVIIGTNLYVQQSLNLEIIIKDADDATREMYRNLDKGGQEIISGDYLNNNVTFAQRDGVNSFTFFYPIIFPGGDTVQFRSCTVTGYGFSAMVTARGCNSTRVDLSASLTETCLDNAGTPGNPSDDFLSTSSYSGDWTIDWGDGTIQTINATSSPSLSHSYSEEASFDIAITVNYINDLGTASSKSQGLAVNTFSTSCTGRNKNKADFFDGDDNDDDYAIGVKLWKRQSVFRSTAGAYTHGWHYEEAAVKWKRFSGELWTEIYADWRDEDCDPDNSDFERDACSSCRRKRVVVGTGTRRDFYQTGDIRSEHSMTIHSTIQGIPSTREMTRTLRLFGC